MMEPMPAAPVRGTQSRHLTVAAIAAGVVAAVLLLVVAEGDGDGDPGGSSDWILGLLLIAAPLLFAGITHSLVGSRLLRPLGSVAVLLCALAAAVHVGVAVDGAGQAGWLYAGPAILTPLLLLGAVVKGSVGRVTDLEFGPMPTSHPVPDDVGGPPLDVLGPLRSARSHAVKSVVAWIIAGVVMVVVAVPALRLLGWPEVAAELHGSVVATTEVDDGTAVEFRARDGDRTVRWGYVVEDSNWEVGEPVDAVLDEDGNVHHESNFGLAGPALFMPVFLFGLFALAAVRRLWGLILACWDVERGSDQPRLGYAAVIDDPAPKTWRPLLAVWWDDPCTHTRLDKPDAVYRGDDETSAHLECPASDVTVHRAWIDTGLSPASKPRWLGAEEGVAVPHRRMILGRWYVHRVTRRSDVRPPEPLRHGPPNPGQTFVSETSFDRHRLGGMVAWRLLGAGVALGLSFLLLADNPGRPAQIDEELSWIPAASAAS